MGDLGFALRVTVQSRYDKIAQLSQRRSFRDAGPVVMDRQTVRENVGDGVEITLAQRPDALAADLVGPAPAMQGLEHVGSNQIQDSHGALFVIPSV